MKIETSSTNRQSPKNGVSSPRSLTSEEVQLSATLLKKTSRGKAYYNRFVQLTANNRLRYYKKEGDVRPKRVLNLPELLDCEISDLFVDKWKNRTIYCVKISWTSDEDVFTSNDSAYVDDEMASLDDGRSMKSRNQDTHGAASSKYHARVSNNGFRAPYIAGEFSSHRANKQRRIGGDSVDYESLTFRTGLKRRQRMVGDAGSEVPSEVEIDNQRVIYQGQEGDKTVRASNQSPYDEQKQAEQKYLENQYASNKKKNQRKAKEKFVQSSKIVVAAGAAIGVSVATAGIGLIAGLVVLAAGAASGAGSAALGAFSNKREGELVFGSHDFEEMQSWRASLVAMLESGKLNESTWGQLFVSDGRKTRCLLLPASKDAIASPDASSSRRYTIERNTTWVPLRPSWVLTSESRAQSLRILKEEAEPILPRDSHHKRHFFTGVSVEGGSCSPLKAHIIAGAPALDVFLCTMSNGYIASESAFPTFQPGLRSSFRAIERIDDHTDIIHMIFRPIYLPPLWTTARDFVLYRYWRLEPDGSYVICYESMDREDCPPVPGFVRAEMHQVIAIAPPKMRSTKKFKHKEIEVKKESMVTAVVQIDPKGWIPKQSIPCFRDACDAFGINALLQLIDIKDAIDIDRFIPAWIDGNVYEHQSQVPGDERAKSLNLPALMLEHSGANDSDHRNKMLVDDDHFYDFHFAGRESTVLLDAPAGIACSPPPLPIERWAEPDANSFRVRGATYLSDHHKINAGESIGRLIAVDVVSVDEPIFSGMTRHPSERMQRALEREKMVLARGEPTDLPPFIFVVNIILPGPPIYHGVFYFAIDDMSQIDGSDGTPSSKVCQDFIFGACDEFRDKTFKLIPQIVQGNFMVRKAVGTTPAIMGKKLAQYYVRTDRSFEVILDCGSSAVAKGVIRLSLGYAKSLVVDMGFLLEGQTAEALPERLLGCVRVKYPEFDPEKLRKVERPQSL